jgi:hypothetical protein
MYGYVNDTWVPYDILYYVTNERKVRYYMQQEQNNLRISVQKNISLQTRKWLKQKTGDTYGDHWALTG